MRANTFNPYAKDAADAKPEGWCYVNAGEIRPDDMLWSWCEQRFRRADDPEWQSTVTDAADAVYVIRNLKSLRPQAAPGQTVRTYRLERLEPKEPEEPQKSLF